MGQEPVVKKHVLVVASMLLSSLKIHILPKNEGSGDLWQTIAFINLVVYYVVVQYRVSKIIFFVNSASKMKVYHSTSFSGQHCAFLGYFSFVRMKVTNRVPLQLVCF